VGNAQAATSGELVGNVQAATSGIGSWLVAKMSG
jgi:hypothetical protein